MRYRYRPQVLDQLALHGLRPRPDTTPERLKDYLNDLYRYELRCLRDRLIRGLIAKPGYSEHVRELRKKYILLSVPLRLWTLEG